MSIISGLVIAIFVYFLIVTCSCEEVEFLTPESIEDQIIKDILSHSNVSNITISRKGEHNVYQFYINETSAKKNTDQCKHDNHLLKYVNTTHTCYVLGNDTNYMINQIIEMTNNSTNITNDMLENKLFKFDEDNNLFLVDTGNNRTELRLLASFHQLNYNEINHRRRNPRRRYIDDDDDDDDGLSKKERKKRKKRRKKMRKRQKKMKKRKKGFFDDVKSTVKWVACVQISVAVCGCCLSVVQSVFLSYFSPLPIGTRIQPVNQMYARGFEEYGMYGGGYNIPFSDINNVNLLNYNNNNRNNNNNLNNVFNLNNVIGNGILGNIGGVNRN
ncbi:hypothetical protein FG386_002209 [Cryptosporidium ryanae]|uniref:uncharacterized protein n=1 Tax=Cryptosporidium ryanae TaxID=515981 RepID=UPI003519F272|nr:hypothetical protein FG386_002209 [Cryptosporidium ryanae]